MESIFHDCWNDPDRMRSLYSEFRSKSLNPHGWDDKMSFWKQAITEWCKQRKTLHFSFNELYNSLEWKGTYPQCLQNVIEEMNRDNILMKPEEFNTKFSHTGWMAWSLNILVKQPLGWGWSIVRNSVFGAPAPSCQHINTVVLKEMSTNVLQRLREKYDSATAPCSALHNECRDICPDLEDFNLILHHLQFEGNVAVFVEDEQKLVKVNNTKNSSVSLTETDIGVVRLQKAQQTVEKEISKLKVEIDRCKQDALVAVKSGLKNKAQLALAKKQRVEKQLDKKLATLDNIEKMKEQLLQSDSNKEVFDAYQSGVDALKSAMKKDLNIDKLDDTMAEIEEALETHSEIQTTLSRSIKSEEDADLESELDQLLQESTESEKLNDDLSALNLNTSVEIQFPKIPQDSPQKLEDQRHVLMH